MTVVVVILLALMTTWLLVLDLRLKRAQTMVRFLANRTLLLERQMDTLWISPDHQIPPHLTRVVKR